VVSGDPSWACAPARRPSWAPSTPMEIHGARLRGGYGDSSTRSWGGSCRGAWFKPRGRRSSRQLFSPASRRGDLSRTTSVHAMMKPTWAPFTCSSRERRTARRMACLDSPARSQTTTAYLPRSSWLDCKRGGSASRATSIVRRPRPTCATSSGSVRGARSKMRAPRARARRPRCHFLPSTPMARRAPRRRARRQGPLIRVDLRRRARRRAASPPPAALAQAQRHPQQDSRLAALAQVQRHPQQDSRRPAARAQAQRHPQQDSRRPAALAQAQRHPQQDSRRPAARAQAQRHPQQDSRRPAALAQAQRHPQQDSRRPAALAQA
jgi:hypothetical protein